MTPECELLMAETSCPYLLLFLSADFFSLAMSSSGSVAFSASTSGCRYWTAHAPGMAGMTGVTRNSGIEGREGDRRRAGKQSGPAERRCTKKRAGATRKSV